MAIADTAPAVSDARPAAALPAPDGDPGFLTADDRVELLRAMLRMRGIEQRAMSLYRQGKVHGSF